MNIIGKYKLVSNASAVSQNATLTNNNLTAYIGNLYCTVRANIGKSSGKYYCEVKFNTARGTGVNMGLVSESIKDVARTYDNPTAIFYRGDLAIGDTISILIDMDNRQLEFWRNGVSQGVHATKLTDTAYYPAMSNNGHDPTVTFNFGESDFLYEIPTGYKAYIWESVSKFLISNGDGTAYSIESGGMSENLIPTMTSNTSPSGVASSSRAGTGYEPYKAFDRNNSTYAMINSTAGDISYEFKEPQRITRYSILVASSNNGNPKDWTFEGSNDGVTWDILDRRENVLDWVANTFKVYDIKNNQKFKRYRLNVSSNRASNSQILIHSMEMFEYVSPSLKILGEISEDIFLTYGLDEGNTLNLESDISRVIHITDQNETLGSGKVFKTKLDTKKYSIKSVSTI